MKGTYTSILLHWSDWTIQLYFAYKSLQAKNPTRAYLEKRGGRGEESLFICSLFFCHKTPFSLVWIWKFTVNRIMGDQINFHANCVLNHEKLATWRFHSTRLTTAGCSLPNPTASNHRQPSLQLPASCRSEVLCMPLILTRITKLPSGRKKK